VIIFQQKQHSVQASWKIHPRCHTVRPYQRFCSAGAEINEWKFV